MNSTRASITLSLNLMGELVLEAPPSRQGGLTAPLVIPGDARGMALVLRTLRALRTIGPSKFGAAPSSPTQSQVDEWIARHGAGRVDEIWGGESPDALGV